MTDVEIPNGYLLSPEERLMLLNSPAAPTPADVTSHFGEPREISIGILFFLSITLALTTFFAVVRIYARMVIVKSFAISEFLTIVAYGLLVGFIYVYYQLTLEVGWYVHQWNISLRTLGNYLYLFHIGVSLYSTLVPAIKAAILLDWIAIFVPKTRSAFFWTCHVVLWVNVIFYLITLALAQLICKPLVHFWDPFTKGHCTPNGRVADLATAAFNSVSDIIILILPQTIIWKLHMTRDKKLGIAAIFAIGLLACVASIVRLAYVAEYLHATDQTYVAAPFLLWTLAESAAIFLVLCVPSSPKVLGRNSRFTQFAISTFQSLGHLLTQRRGSSSDVATREPGDAVPSYIEMSGDDIPMNYVASKGKSPAASQNQIQRQDV